MTLTTHAIAGAAIGKILQRHWLLAIIAALASHFILDAIPHWDYTLLSKKKNVERKSLDTDMVLGRAFIVDLLHIGFDFALGIGLSLLLLQPAHQPLHWIILIGALAGMLPDALQFVYFKFRRQPFIALQRFHYWCHANLRITDWKIGVTLQALLVAAMILVVR